MTQCKCDLRIRLLGDGCRYCNPQEHIDQLVESLEEQRTWAGLTVEEIADMAADVYGAAHCDDVTFATKLQNKLKEKNETQ